MKITFRTVTNKTFALDLDPSVQVCCAYCLCVVHATSRPVMYGLMLCKVEAAGYEARV